MTGDHGATGSQGSADPPAHVGDRAKMDALQGRSPNEDAYVAAEDNEATLREAQMRGETPGPAGAHQEARVGPDTQRRRAADGAREPAPGDANPLAERKGRGGDQRTNVYEG